MRSGLLRGSANMGCGNGTGARDWGLDAHRKDGIEISFLEAGTIDFPSRRRNKNYIRTVHHHATVKRFDQPSMDVGKYFGLTIIKVPNPAIKPEGGFPEQKQADARGRKTV